MTLSASGTAVRSRWSQSLVSGAGKNASSASALAAPIAPTYGKRVLFVLLLGLTAALWSDFSEPIWWAHPWTYHLMTFVANVTTWGFAGLILARFVPESDRAHA